MAATVLSKWVVGHGQRPGAYSRTWRPCSLPTEVSRDIDCASPAVHACTSDMLGSRQPGLAHRFPTRMTALEALPPVERFLTWIMHGATVRVRSKASRARLWPEELVALRGR